jgi:hypothetical protein
MVYLLSSSTTDEIFFNLPARPYKSTYKFSWDVEKLEDNTYVFYDNGIAYDTATCECSFFMKKSYALTFDTFIRNYRTEPFTMIMDDTDGFFPFFPHRGNAGGFYVSAEIVDFKGFQSSPYAYFQIDVKFTALANQVWPAYTAPTQVPEGDLIIDGVSGIRYPESNFEPALDFSKIVAYTENNTAFFDTHGANADQATTTLKTRLNTGNAAALFKQLITVRRSGAFDLTVKNNQFPFGEHYGDNRTFSCQLINDSIELTHQEHNMFETELKLYRVSG